MGAVAISRAVWRHEIGEFIELPFHIYRNDANWVAPLRSEIRKQLDSVRNPFFRHARAALFLARRDGRVVGRISAQVDDNYDALHGGATGFWGFFECEEDPDVAEALFDVAAEWLAGRGRRQMVGPASFTLNDEAGLLIDAFDSPPVVMMSYNPPYYELLVEKAGFAAAQDLLAYRLDTNAEPPADVVEFARSAEGSFTFRTLDMKRFDAELERYLEVYNSAWEQNWGFAPMSEGELRRHAEALKPIVDPNLVFIAERDGETAAVSLTIPNLNEALIRAHGRLGPVGAARLLWHAKRHRWNACRVVTLGVKSEHRRSGVAAHLYVDTLLAARRGGYAWGEMSWILESNTEMNRAIMHMGGTRYKTYRMYERSV